MPTLRKIKRAASRHTSQRFCSTFNFAQPFAAHLILPNRSQANLPPDQWTVDIWAATFDNNRVIKINFTSYLDELNLN